MAMMTVRRFQIDLWIPFSQPPHRYLCERTSNHTLRNAAEKHGVQVTYYYNPDKDWDFRLAAVFLSE